MNINKYYFIDNIIMGVMTRSMLKNNDIIPPYECKMLSDTVLCIKINDNNDYFDMNINEDELLDLCNKLDKNNEMDEELFLSISEREKRYIERSKKLNLLKSKTTLDKLKEIINNNELWSFKLNYNFYIENEGIFDTYPKDQLMKDIEYIILNYDKINLNINSIYIEISKLNDNEYKYNLLNKSGIINKNRLDNIILKLNSISNKDLMIYYKSRRL